MTLTLTETLSFHEWYLWAILNSGDNLEGDLFLDPGLHASLCDGNGDPGLEPIGENTALLLFFTVDVYKIKIIILSFFLYLLTYLILLKTNLTKRTKLAKS